MPMLNAGNVHSLPRERQTRDPAEKMKPRIINYSGTLVAFVRFAPRRCSAISPASDASSRENFTRGLAGRRKKRHLKYRTALSWTDNESVVAPAAAR